MKLAEEAAKHRRLLDDYSDFTLTTTRAKFGAYRQAPSELDPVLRMVHDPYADMFATNEPDESSLVPVFQRGSFVDDICFGGTAFDDFGHTGQAASESKVNFLSHEVSPEGIRADPKKMTAITKLLFPKSKKGMKEFIGSLNYYSRFIRDFAVYGAALYKLKEDDFSEGVTWLRPKSVLLRSSEKQLKLLSYGISMRRRRRQTTSCPLLLTSPQGCRDEHSAEKEVLALLLLLKVCYTQLAGKTLHVYTRFSTLEWVHKSKSLFGRAVQFAVLLSPWQLEVQRVREKDCVFTQLLQSTITNLVDL
ncbi:hypothetical protein PHMEG_00037819, partial [Phytophthora megakarya]